MMILLNMKNDLIKYFNLDALSKEDIKDQYNNLKIFAYLVGYGHHIKNVNKSIIYESVDYTTKANDLIKELKVLFNFKDW